MTSKRKVRKDFDPHKKYAVDVSGCTNAEKAEVQQAFFDVGFLWKIGGKGYKHFESPKYTNISNTGQVTKYCMFGLTTEGCNMTAKEFLNLVYEPVQKGHPHAHLMALYAEDAKTTVKPWELWQVKCDAGIWWNCREHPKWGGDTEYRRKPKTHTVNGVEVPDLRIEAKEGDRYYLVDLTERDFNHCYIHIGDALDSLWVSRGLCYEPTEEGKQAAILHAKAMLGIA